MIMCAKNGPAIDKQPSVLTANQDYETRKRP